MQRILVAECKQEVSTFNPHPSTYGDFDIRHGAALFDYHAKVGTEVGGVLDVLCKTPGVEPVPTYGACFITSGGPLSPALASSFRLAEGRSLSRTTTATSLTIRFLYLASSLLVLNLI